MRQLMLAMLQGACQAASDHLVLRRRDHQTGFQDAPGPAPPPRQPRMGIEEELEFLRILDDFPELVAVVKMMDGSVALKAALKEPKVLKLLGDEEARRQVAELLLMAAGVHAGEPN